MSGFAKIPEFAVELKLNGAEGAVPSVELPENEIAGPLWVRALRLTSWAGDGEKNFFL